MHRSFSRYGLWLCLCLGSGCDVYEDRYACQRDEQCMDPGHAAPPGRCVEGGCAWEDGMCPSGYRFGVSAGSERAGTCVPSLPPPDPTPFTQVPLRDGQTDAATLSLVFGVPGTGPIFVAGREGKPFLIRRDGPIASPLSPPAGDELPVAGVADASRLALALSDRVYRSTDGGMTWSESVTGKVAGLALGKGGLYVLTEGQVLFLQDGGGAPALSFDPAMRKARAVAFFSSSGPPGVGDADAPMLVGLSESGRGVIYRKEAQGWQVMHEATAALSAGWAGEGGVWIAVGAGVLLRNGAPVVPAPASAPRLLLGARENDLWALGDGWNHLLHSRGTGWETIRPDAQGATVTGLWVGRAGEQPQVWVTSAYPGDRTYRARLLRYP
jgi:hypothetical protein